MLAFGELVMNKTDTVPAFRGLSIEVISELPWGKVYAGGTVYGVCTVPLTTGKTGEEEGTRLPRAFSSLFPADSWPVSRVLGVLQPLTFNVRLLSPCPAHQLCGPWRLGYSTYTHVD